MSASPVLIVSTRSHASAHINAGSGIVLAIRYRVLAAHMIAVDLGAVNSLLGLLGIVNISHVDKRKSSRSASSRIGDQLYFVEASVFLEHASQVSLLSLEVEAEDADDSTRTRIQATVVGRR